MQRFNLSFVFVFIFLSVIYCMEAQKNIDNSSCLLPYNANIDYKIKNFSPFMINYYPRESIVFDNDSVNVDTEATSLSIVAFRPIRDSVTCSQMGNKIVEALSKRNLLHAVKHFTINPVDNSNTVSVHKNETFDASIMENFPNLQAFEMNDGCIDSYSNAIKYLEVLVKRPNILHVKLKFCLLKPNNQQANSDMLLKIDDLLASLSKRLESFNISEYNVFSALPWFEAMPKLDNLKQIQLSDSFINFDSIFLEDLFSNPNRKSIEISLNDSTLVKFLKLNTVNTSITELSIMEHIKFQDKETVKAIYAKLFAAIARIMPNLCVFKFRAEYRSNSDEQLIDKYLQKHPFSPLITKLLSAIPSLESIELVKWPFLIQNLCSFTTLRHLRLTSCLFSLQEEQSFGTLQSLYVHIGTCEYNNWWLAHIENSLKLSNLNVLILKGQVHAEHLMESYINIFNKVNDRMQYLGLNFYPNYEANHGCKNDQYKNSIDSYLVALKSAISQPQLLHLDLAQLFGGFCMLNMLFDKAGASNLLIHVGIIYGDKEFSKFDFQKAGYKKYLKMSKWFLENVHVDEDRIYIEFCASEAYFYGLFEYDNLVLRREMIERRNAKVEDFPDGKYFMGDIPGPYSSLRKVRIKAN